MLDVVIRMKNIPESCYACDIGQSEYLDCPYFEEQSDERLKRKRHERCPILEAWPSIKPIIVSVERETEAPTIAPAT